MSGRASKVGIKSKISDTRADVRKNKLKSLGFSSIENVELVDNYTIDHDLNEEQLGKIASMLTNPVSQESLINKNHLPEKADWVIEIGFHPGVTDNVASTAREGIEDFLGAKFSSKEGVYTSQTTYLTGNLSEAEVKQIAESMANPLINRIEVKRFEDFAKEPMSVRVPRVKIEKEPSADLVDILTLSDEALVKIGKQGIANADGSRRGPLALDINYMKAI
jgi:phosphoribosylformylglycinamidine synthase